MKDADNVCERLCWVMHDGVVNGSLVNKFWNDVGNTGW